VFHLDETSRPKKIDISSEEERKGRFGSYRFDGDRLVLCIGEDDEKDRPTEFTSRGGRGRTVAVFRRAVGPETGWARRFHGILSALPSRVLSAIFSLALGPAVSP
jgi:hypothetical protein